MTMPRKKAAVHLMLPERDQHGEGPRFNGLRLDAMGTWCGASGYVAPATKKFRGHAAATCERCLASVAAYAAFIAKGDTK